MDPLTVFVVVVCATLVSFSIILGAHTIASRVAKAIHTNRALDEHTKALEYIGQRAKEYLEFKHDGTF